MLASGDFYLESCVSKSLGYNDLDIKPSLIAFTIGQVTASTGRSIILDRNPNVKHYRSSAGSQCFFQGVSLRGKDFL